jgi:pimeloyl-ACP methyl ester carboxylesterase
MMLKTTETGPESDLPPVLLAHGLFGSGKNLGGLARRLAATRRVISVDMRNHGDSPHDPDHSYAALAGDLAELIAAQGGRADVLGHSMGGKAAMMLALTRPELVRRLVVLDIAPYAYHHREGQSELIDAMESVRLDGLRLPPLMIRHGTADSIVSAGQAERLRKAWHRADPSAEIDFALLQGEGHGTRAFGSPALMEQLAAFLSRHLGATRS